MNELFPLIARNEGKQDESYERIKQGAEANISGKLCETAIQEAFKIRGIFVKQYETTIDLFEKRILFQNAPYISIYGAHSKSEFLYCHGNNLKVRIECRSQQVSGSVDEKFPYLLSNAKEAMPEKYIWLVVEGIGARSKAIKWLKNGSELVKTKTIRVFNVIEAQRAIKKLVEDGAA